MSNFSYNSVQVEFVLHLLESAMNVFMDYFSDWKMLTLSFVFDSAISILPLLLNYVV